MNEVIYYSNWDLFSDDNMEYAREFLLMDGEYDNADEITDDELERYIYDMDEVYWEDFESEIKSCFSRTRAYVVSGSAGLWNGRSPSGSVVYRWDDLVRGLGLAYLDYLKFFQNADGDFEIWGMHHDGTNRYILRELTEAGIDFVEENSDSLDYDRRSLVETLFNNSKYSKKFRM